MKKELKAIKNTAILIISGVKYATLGSFYFSKRILEGFLFSPTCFRKMFKNIDEHDKMDSDDLMRFVTIPQPVSLTLYGAMYSEIYKSDSNLFWKILGVHITTNVLSGLYEIYRYQKNKLTSPTNTSSASPSALEKKVEEEPKIEVKPQQPTSPKYDIPDPWKVKTEEIEDVRYSGINSGGRR
jgi:hypothetical protein